MPDHSLLILLGPTASGKTRLAVRIADVLGGQIISADSRQVFKGMDIGTGKDLNEYVYNGKSIPYHLIDIREAGTLYNVHEFKADFYRVYTELSGSGVLPILCGGTGMYIHSLLQNQAYTAIPRDETFREKLLPLAKEELKQRLLQFPDDFVKHVDFSSHKRMIRALEIADYLSKHKFVEESYPELNPIVIGLRSEIPLRRSKVIERLNKRFHDGMIQEVQGLLEAGIDPKVLEFYGLEYKFITSYLLGELSFSDLNEKLAIAICQFAKRQMTFFRKMEKDGVCINWIDSALPIEEQLAQVFSKLV